MKGGGVQSDTYVQPKDALERQEEAKVEVNDV